MKSLIIAGAAALALTVSGCESANPLDLFEGDTAEHDVFGITVAYTAVAGAALEYESLPRCSDAQPAPCSEPAAVEQIRNVDNVAFNAIQTAQSVVRDNPDSIRAQQALTDAFATILAFEEMLLSLGLLEEPVAETTAEEAS